jgi:hypothetical protein
MEICDGAVVAGVCTPTKEDPLQMWQGTMTLVKIFN